MQVLRRNGGFAGYGQDLVGGAHAMLGSNAIQDESWPYFWEHPKSQAEIVGPFEWIPAPANGDITTILELTVPAGYRFVLKGITQRFSTDPTGGQQFVEGSGSILWTIDVDNPTGSISLSGFGLPYLSNMKEQRGTQERPWPIMGYQVFDAFQTLRYKCVTAAPINEGAPNYIGAGLFGWWHPLIESQQG